MNEEDKIAQQLASNLPPAEVRSYGYTDPEPGTKDPLPETGAVPVTPEDPFAALMNKQQVMSYFAVTPNSADANRLASVIDNILDFAKRESGSADAADILKVIRQTERELGSILQPDRLNKINTFINVRNQIRLLEEKQRALYA